jgi:hypothetical protein
MPAITETIPKKEGTRPRPRRRIHTNTLAVGSEQLPLRCLHTCGDYEKAGFSFLRSQVDSMKKPSPMPPANCGQSLRRKAVSSARPARRLSWGSSATSPSASRWKRRLPGRRGSGKPPSTRRETQSGFWIRTTGYCARTRRRRATFIARVPR